MNGVFHHLRLPWFALAAIVGMLSMAGEASARSTAEVPKSCCVVPTPSKCCCCPAKAETPPASANHRDATSAGEARLSSSDRPCECRSDEPVAPASKPESSPTERRPERSGDESIASTFSVRPSAPSARFEPPIGCPPKSPLHLLTTHLLF